MLPLYILTFNSSYSFCSCFSFSDCLPIVYPPRNTPPYHSASNRTLYFFEGAGVSVGGRALTSHSAVGTLYKLNPSCDP